MTERRLATKLIFSQTYLCFPPSCSSIPSTDPSAPPSMSSDAACPAIEDISRAHSTWHSTVWASSPGREYVKTGGRRRRLGMAAL